MTNLHFVLLLAVVVFPASVLAQSSAFTYQGSLFENGQPSTGNVDFRFRLWDAVAGGTQVAAPAEAPSVAVNSGRLSVQLDFGTQAFDGSDRWLEVIIVDPAGDSVLSPRQPVTATPYSLRALLSAPASEPLLTSGLPNSSSISITLSDLPAIAPITLGAPLRFTQSFNLTSGLYGSPAQVDGLVLRRMRGSDPSWRDAALAAQSGLEITMRLDVAGGGIEWKVTGALATGWGLVVADDGLPVEELVLTILVANFNRSVIGTPAVAPPPSVALNRSIQSGLVPGDLYRIVIDGLDVADYRVAGDVLEVTAGAAAALMLRQNPTADITLVDWFLGQRVRSFELQLQTATTGAIVLTADNQAGATAYTIRLADDGLPIEEFEISYQP